MEILLVDADFAKPDVLERLGLPEGPGLLDALSGAVGRCRGLHPRHRRAAALACCPAGTTHQQRYRDAGDRTAPTRSSTGWRAANPRRIVIFDSAARARRLACVGAGDVHAGQVMLVVRADRTSESDLREATAMSSTAASISSCVLNSVCSSPAAAGSGALWLWGGGEVTRLVLVAFAALGPRRHRRMPSTRADHAVYRGEAGALSRTWQRRRCADLFDRRRGRRRAGAPAAASRCRSAISTSTASAYDNATPGGRSDAQRRARPAPARITPELTLEGWRHRRARPVGYSRRCAPATSQGNLQQQQPDLFGLCRAEPRRPMSGRCSPMPPIASATPRSRRPTAAPGFPRASRRSTVYDDLEGPCRDRQRRREIGQRCLPVGVTASGSFTREDAGQLD